MTRNCYAIVWIDHREAKIFHFNSIEVDRLVIRPHDPERHIHHKADSRDKEKSIAGADAPLVHELFEEVVEAIVDAKAILITGPASAKSELVTHITRFRPDIAGQVIGVETINHPGDGALLAVARIYFKTENRTHL